MGILPWKDDMKINNTVCSIEIIYFLNEIPKGGCTSG